MVPEGARGGCWRERGGHRRRVQGQGRDVDPDGLPLSEEGPVFRTLARDDSGAGTLNIGSGTEGNLRGGVGVGVRVVRPGDIRPRTSLDPVPRTSTGFHWL